MIRPIAFGVTLLTLAALPLSAQTPPAELTRLRGIATHVTITRDDWGIAHVHGRTDAEVAFGMIYAQAEDDFHRIERNYLTALGRTAEADGGSGVYADLRQRLYIDPTELEAEYQRCPRWLRAVMQGWADGLNYYIATHPQVTVALRRSHHIGCLQAYLKPLTTGEDS
jgi:acyl-homoserine-lactone acylase